MHGNILQCYPVILPSQVIMHNEITLVSAFHVQGNILLSFLAILPSLVILPSDDVIATSADAVVRIRYNKTIVALVRGQYENLFTIDS